MGTFSFETFTYCLNVLDCHIKVTQLHESARFARPVEKEIFEEEATEKGDEEEKDIVSAKIIVFHIHPPNLRVSDDFL